MAKQVTIKITSKASYVIVDGDEAFVSRALRDTTEGASYAAILYAAGEVCSDGVKTPEITAEFRDDNGDTVFSFYSSGKWEVV